MNRFIRQASSRIALPRDVRQHGGDHAVRTRAQNPNDARVAICILVGLLLTFAYIGPGYEGLKNNSVPRLGMVFAVVFDRSLVIDSYNLHTPDMAFLNGHYYSDKAPGLSLTAAPTVAVLVGAARLAGIATTPVRDGQFTDFAMAASHVATTMTSGLAVAFAAAMLFLLARSTGLSRGAALFGTLSYSVASPAFGWATMFLGHALSGALLFVAFAMIVRTAPGQRLLLRGTAIGALLTWACVVEYTTGLASIIVGLLGLVRLLRLPGRGAVAAAGGVMVGTVLALAPLLLYNQAAFGSPFTIGYQYVVGFEPMRQGTMGLGRPSAHVAWELLFGSFRGIVWLSPLLLVFPAAAWAAVRRFPTDVTITIVAVPIAYFVVNTCYFDWSGGASTGPRHLVPALGFVGCAYAALWDRLRSPAWHVVLAALLAAGAGLSLVCATTMMGAANTPAEPLVPYLWHAFVIGDVHNVLAFILRRVPGWSDAGAMHLLTLLPILAIWGLTSLLTRPARDQTDDRPLPNLHVLHRTSR